MAEQDHVGLLVRRSYGRHTCNTMRCFFYFLLFQIRLICIRFFHLFSFIIIRTGDIVKELLLRRRSHTDWGCSSVDHKRLHTTTDAGNCDIKAEIGLSLAKSLLPPSPYASEAALLGPSHLDQQYILHIAHAASYHVLVSADTYPALLARREDTDNRKSGSLEISQVIIV